MEHNREAVRTRLEDYRKKSLEMRADVLRARETIGVTQFSPEFSDALRYICTLAQTYQPSQGAPAAIYVLAQVADRLGQLMAPWQEIESYEVLQEQIRHLEDLYG